MNSIVVITGFAIVALASEKIGKYFAKVQLPLISGFLFAGIITGPFVLNLITVETLKTMHFVDQLSLGFIAFYAGSVLCLKTLRSHLKSIKWITVGLAISTFIIGSCAVFMLADYIPFMKNLPVSGTIAISILVATILVARSPSSAIAIISELNARGPFTQIALGVTIVTDVVVIILFAINISIADALLVSFGFDINVIALVIIELIISLIFGYLLGKLLVFILSCNINSIIKTGIILLGGYAVFILSEEIRSISHARLPFEILLEPLLICMIGGFFVTNYSDYRQEFRKILYDIGPTVYLLFFTLTGASLALDILAITWPIALALFFVRLVAIFIGSFGGGILAGDSKQYNKIGWMTYITQAGVSLGLAKQVSSEFPGWGDEFLAVIIAVIVLNQIVGPIFFKWGINLAKESHPAPETPEMYGGNIIIFGSGNQATSLAHQLYSYDWNVKMVTSGIHSIKKMAGYDIDICSVPDITLDVLHQLGAKKVSTIVALLSDKENYHICEMAYKYLGTKKLIVNLNEKANFDRFYEIGAVIVEANTALVSLIDCLVRLPTDISLLPGVEKEHLTTDLEIKNPDLHGTYLRELKLPSDAFTLSVCRGDQILISYDYTKLEIGDVVTITGSRRSLKEIKSLFDI